MNYVSSASFRRLLMDAVADLSNHGYRSEMMVGDWMRLLRFAAERELGTELSIDDEMRRAMDSVFRKATKETVLQKTIPGVQRYAVERVRPALRAELDRRIVASADLIKLNRRAAIDKTIQRFQGWSTSIPRGGDENVDRLKVREQIGKSISQARFEARRVAIDQGHKLSAAVHEIVALDNGAIAAVWHSHWRRPGYNYRKDHKELDGETFLVSDSWALKQGLIKPAGRKYIDDVERPKQLPYCSCEYVYVTSPRRLPEDMLTEKGKAWVRGEKIAA